MITDPRDAELSELRKSESALRFLLNRAEARIASLEAENARLLAAMGPLGTPPLPNDPRLP